MSAPPTTQSRSLIGTIKTWCEFVKISHTLFALPFALASMVVAARDTKGWPGWKLFGLIVAAMFCARTCAMAFNRIMDRDIDAKNPRTANRHLPSGQISLFSAWLLWATAAIGFVAVTYHINTICFILSPVALAVVCFYSLTKRFTDFSHFYLGIALALAPIGAWLAVKGGFVLMPLRESAVLPLMMAVAVVFWLVGFDVIYAIQDYEFDRKHGLHSLVVRWGPQNALRAAFLSHFLMLLILLLFGLLCRFRVAYFVGLSLIIICVMLEHWIAGKRSLNWVQTAFFKLNAVISIVFLTVVVAEVAFPDFFRLMK
ncbi:MAG: UbiA-like polyprenyltransferase [Verrucomicrobiota bacterium]